MAIYISLPFVANKTLGYASQIERQRVGARIAARTQNGFTSEKVLNPKAFPRKPNYRIQHRLRVANPPWTCDVRPVGNNFYALCGSPVE